MRPISITQPQRSIDRRQFLKWLGTAGAAAFIAACQPRSTPTPEPTAAPSTTPKPTALPPTSTPLPPSATPTAIPPSATPDPRTPVAVARMATYDQAGIRQQLEVMLDSLGGPGEWIKPGARVGIKTNLTGMPFMDRPGMPVGTEYYTTHPAVVGALGELLKDAGVASIVIFDGLGDPTTFDAWGYTEMANALGAKLVDLCDPAPYKGFKAFPTGDGSLVYERYFLHPCLAEIDGLISVAKLKCHATTGVTLSMKNLIGLAPISEYKRQPDHTNRSAFHESTVYDTRLPGVIMDLNRAVPVRLAVIDGIKTAEGGAGPWQTTLTPVQPGLLVAARDPVAADTVGTALMGFDPESKGGDQPFLHSDNHLAMAAGLGLGTNKLAEIRVEGVQIEEARYPFKPAP
jgi:uncharacterized protein (DUF362 family)